MKFFHHCNKISLISLHITFNKNWIIYQHLVIISIILEYGTTAAFPCLLNTISQNKNFTIYIWYSVNWYTEITICKTDIKLPSEEFELTAKSLKLTETSFWGHSVTSQWTHEMTHTMSLLWAVREFEMSSPCSGSRELTAITAWWAHSVISWIAHSKLPVWVANSWRRPQEGSQQAHSVSSSCEFAVS